MKNNNDEKKSLWQDIGLLVFISLFSITAVLMSLSGNILLNVIYLFCTILLLMITYFFGVLPSLISNIIFIGIQAIIMTYQFVVQVKEIPWQLSFWMVVPILLSLALYSMTKNQVELQKSNGELRTALIERGAFDEQTNLRTTVAYIEDIAVFAETNRRFDIPVTTAIIKIRYFNDLKRMMSPNQMKLLLKLTTDAKGAGIATSRIKDGFEKKVKSSDSLSNMAISMVVGIASWDSSTMKTPYDLMNAGIHETQYDV